TSPRTAVGQPPAVRAGIPRLLHGLGSQRGSQLSDRPGGALADRVAGRDDPRVSRRDRRAVQRRSGGLQHRDRRDAVLEPQAERRSDAVELLEWLAINLRRGGRDGDRARWNALVLPEFG